MRDGGPAHQGQIAARVQEELPKSVAAFVEAVDEGLAESNLGSEVADVMRRNIGAALARMAC